MYVAVRPPTSTVHIFNLIRLDLAYPLTGRAIKGGRLNANWKFEDEATLLALHARLEEYFQDEPFGMYHAVVELVGHDRADALVESGQLKRRVGILREPSTQMTAPATMAGSSTAGPSGSLPRSASAHTGSFSVIPTREHTTTLAERYNIQPPAPATAVARVSSREGTHVRRTGLQDAAPHNSAGSRPSVAPGRSQPPQPTQGMSEKRAGKQPERRATRAPEPMQMVAAPVTDQPPAASWSLQRSVMHPVFRVSMPPASDTPFLSQQPVVRAPTQGTVHPRVQSSQGRKPTASGMMPPPTAVPVPTATKATSARASRQPAVAPPPARTREGAPVPTLPARAAAVTTLGQVGLRSQSVMPAVNSPAERPLRQEDATDRLRARLLQSQADTDPESQSRKRALFRSVSEIPSRSASRSASTPQEERPLKRVKTKNGQTFTFQPLPSPPPRNYDDDSDEDTYSIFGI
ncbi:hypothetical protein FOMPIDRAFT_1054867 [Fomitopsis schrenkii]|uniref:Uncharacterized protein n=1 Tax=Fomitopsis schrenkii TaxID=2126942 RepID=S8DPY2_FOMSC|nr:hypothetical protein FOMPIDRAFT_1054867 [Fomitopsis schrenkii]